VSEEETPDERPYNQDLHNQAGRDFDFELPQQPGLHFLSFVFRRPELRLPFLPAGLPWSNRNHRSPFRWV